MANEFYAMLASILNSRHGHMDGGAAKKIAASNLPMEDSACRCGNRCVDDPAGGSTVI